MDWKDKAQYWIAYESEIEAALHPVFVEFLNRTGLAGGQKVLDIGCGSGGSVLSAADLVGPSGSVTGVDIAPHMTARAGERTAHLAQVDFLTGDAQVLQFEPAKYDIAMSLFGMMFYGDPAAAFSNILSAVRPAGRIVFVAWASGQDNPWFSQPGKAAAMHIPDLPQPDLHAPGPMAFADTDRVLKMLGTAGWSNAKVEDFDLLLTPTASPGDIAAMLFQFGPLPELIRARCSDDNDAATLTKAIRAEIAARLATYDGAEGVRVPAKVRFFSAQRPG